MVWDTIVKTSSETVFKRVDKGHFTLSFFILSERNKILKTNEVSRRRKQIHFLKIKLETGKSNFFYFGSELYNDLP